MELQDHITRENLGILVPLFYKRALDNEELGPIFALEFGESLETEAWKEHLELLVNFWDSIFLNENAYNGDPFGPHFTIVDLKMPYFKTWVGLFSTTAKEIYTPHVAALFQEKAAFFAKEFIDRLSKDTKTEPLSFM